MNELLKVIGLVGVVLVAGVLTSLLQAYIALDVAKLFNIAFIINLGFLKVYGALMIWRMINYTRSKKDQEEEKDGASILGRIAGHVITLLCIWGLIYLTYYAIT